MIRTRFIFFILGLLLFQTASPLCQNKIIMPEGMDMAEMALRFILSSPDISTVIPGMRKLHHVEANIACSRKGPLPESVSEALRSHRWDREPTEWSQ